MYPVEKEKRSREKRHLITSKLPQALSSISNNFIRTSHSNIGYPTKKRKKKEKKKERKTTWWHQSGLKFSLLLATISLDHQLQHQERSLSVALTLSLFIIFQLPAFGVKISFSNHEQHGCASLLDCLAWETEVLKQSTNSYWSFRVMQFLSKHGASLVFWWNNDSGIKP